MKHTVKILIISALVVFGCSQKTDFRQNIADNDTIRTDYKSELENIETEIKGFNYDEVTDKYLAILPSGFIVVKYKYFVVFSDLGEDQTYSIIENDIGNTINAMRNFYVDKSPEELTPLILFKDYDRYKTFVLKNYDIPEHDLSPYGFYKISKNVIVIRYVSWKGSVMHEVTHKFLRSDFPDIPSWFDEGFGALHEKSTFINGNLKAEFSWRIVPIRRAIEQDKYTGLRTLMETNDDELYGQRSTFYYAQARYLLMYLQTKGLLIKYYELFRSTYESDVTGITQLEKIVNKPLEEIDYDLLEYLKSFK